MAIQSYVFGQQVVFAFTSWNVVETGGCFLKLQIRRPQQFRQQIILLMLVEFIFGNFS